MKTAVVLVTYNRLKCLKIAISKYEEQSFLPNIIIVVDNASTDGTYEYLDKWKNVESQISKHVIHNNVNTGGAGGFYTGLKYSMQFDYDLYFWLTMMHLLKKILLDLCFLVIKFLLKM